MCDLVGSDLSRLRSFIHQGKRKKLEYFLNDLSGRREQILSREFDACSYATKFKQEHLLELLADFGKRTKIQLTNIYEECLFLFLMN